MNSRIVEPRCAGLSGLFKVAFTFGLHSLAQEIRSPSVRLQSYERLVWLPSGRYASEMEFHTDWRISRIMKWLTAEPARRGKVSPPTGADEAFIHTTFNQIEGWCRHEAAYLTCCLMASQKQAGLSQGVVEIGVWKGKYLSVLYHNARQYGQPVVGIDEFVWLPREDAVNALEKAFGSLDGLKLIAANSRHLTATDIFEMLGGLRASFISVDGDHAAPAVKSDLELASAALAPGGIMAIDDFMNPHAMSVSEGVYGYFFETQSSIRPFAYTGNKLLAADSAYHARYIEAIALFVEDHEHLPIVREYNQFRAQGSYYVEQHILGSRSSSSEAWSVPQSGL